MAEAGNPNVLLSLLERIYPKQRTLDVELTELCRADDAEFALKEIIKAVSGGQIVLSEGKTLTTLVEALARATKCCQFPPTAYRVTTRPGRSQCRHSMAI
jgi:hypothetical protein